MVSVHMGYEYLHSSVPRETCLGESILDSLSRVKKQQFICSEDYGSAEASGPRWRRGRGSKEDDSHVGQEGCAFLDFIFPTRIAGDFSGDLR